MKIKKNGVTINLTESDINKLRKSTLKEQETPSADFRKLINTISRFHPELKDMSPDVDKAVHYIFDKGNGFSMKNMKAVCKKTPEFCKVAFTTPEVMEELFKVV